MINSGTIDILRTRLKSHQKAKLTFNCENGLARIEQPFRYIAVIDFEATCDQQSPLPYPHEIIEFPLVLIDTKQQIIVRETDRETSMMMMIEL